MAFAIEYVMIQMNTLLSDATYNLSNAATIMPSYKSPLPFSHFKQRGGYGAVLKQFRRRFPVFIRHAQTRNVHFWMMKTGSAARHVSRMDHINRLLLPLKSRGGNWSGVYSQTAANDLRATMLSV